VSLASAPETSAASSQFWLKLVGVAVALLAIGTAIGFYVSGWLMSSPPVFRPAVAAGSTKSVQLTVQTVAAVGPELSSNPDWVSYLVRSQDGRWLRTTLWALPAHATVHVTIYQFDGDSGLRNPFMARVRGTIGNVMSLNGKSLSVIDPNDASHTYAVPQLGLIVPLAGVPDNAKKQCSFAPCTLSQAHNTITFTFHTPGPGRYRWQCFVPCAAGFLNGFGGPMQTLGYMDGFLEVS
jgi:hypothetical protein